MSYDLSSKPLSLWTPDDVCAWVDGMGLGQLAPAFKSNGVAGTDVYSLTTADLVGFGATPFQAKKVLAEVQRLSAPSAPFETTARSIPPAGYPPPPSEGASPPGYPPPPAPRVSPPPMQSYSSQPMQMNGSQPMQAYWSQPMHPYGSQPMQMNGSQPMQSYGSQPMQMNGSQPVGVMHVSGSSEVEKLQQELEREKMKNDLRTEMDMKSRISAAETKAALTPSPTVLVQQPAVAYMPAARERYCGPISLIIGFLIFPCICFCPVDERPVVVGAVPVARAW